MVVGVQLVASDREYVLTVAGSRVRLTLMESRILAALAERSGQVVPRRELALRASPEAPLSDACLHVHIAHLRHKLAAEARRLVTHRGLGYSFRGD